MWPLLIALGKAAAGAAVSAAAGYAVQSAVPKYGMKTPGATPEAGSQEMDFNSLVGQGQNQDSSLKKLELEDRIPPPQY
jgi:hypothetical protein